MYEMEEGPGAVVPGPSSISLQRLATKEGR
jgi:hypothetical protein